MRARQTSLCVSLLVAVWTGCGNPGGGTTLVPTPASTPTPTSTPTSTPTPTPAPTPTPTPTPTPAPASSFRVAAWLPYWDTTHALATLDAQRATIDEVLPFWFSLKDDGSVAANRGARDAALVARARSAGQLVLPTVTGGFDAAATRTVLNDAGLRSTALRNIVDEVARGAYDGIDLDFENTREQNRDDYSRFARELAATLHAQGKLLSVTVFPKESEPGNWSGRRSHDYPALGSAADRFRIMTYASYTTPHAIGPADWVERVGAFAVTVVDPRKVYLGVPFYGYDWPAGGAASALTWLQADALVRAHAPAIRRDPVALEPHFDYNAAGLGHTVWYQDEEAIAAKCRVAKRVGVAGIAIWRLGSEDPRFFDSIRRVLNHR